MTPRSCAHCNARLKSGDVFGVEFAGVYDGVLVWECRRCGGWMPRFEGTDRLAKLSAEYARKVDQ